MWLYIVVAAVLTFGLITYPSPTMIIFLVGAVFWVAGLDDKKGKEGGGLNDKE